MITASLNKQHNVGYLYINRFIGMWVRSRGGSRGGEGGFGVATPPKHPESKFFLIFKCT